MAAFIPDANGRSAITVKNDDGSSIVVYEQGAHLTSWKSADGVEHLYLSSKAVYQDRVAIRGGVPLIFPQFGGYGAMTQSHGFARLRTWKVADAGDGTASFVLRVSLSDLYPAGVTMSDSQDNCVQLRYTIAFSNTQLKLTMKITNLSEELAAPMQFAFHSYFRVSDVSETIINGVNLSRYIDNTKSKGNPDAPLHAPQKLWKIRGEHDRIYPDQACAVVLHDVAAKRSIHVSSATLPDVCIWNPGAAKAANLKDMPNDGFKEFVCVEHGKMLRKKSLVPRSSWIATQEVSILSPGPAPSKL